MLVTRLHRDKDLAPWLLNNLPTELPPTTWKMVLHTAKIFRGKIAFVTFLSGLQVFIQASIPYGIGHLVDEALRSQHLPPVEGFHAVMMAVQFFLGLIMVRMCFDWAIWYYNNTMLRPLYGRQTMEVYGYTLRHPVSYYDSQLAGRIIQKSADLVQSVNRIIEAWIHDISTSLLFCLVSFGYFMYLMPALGVVMVFWLLIYGALAYAVARKTIPFIHKHNDARSTVTGRYADLISNIRNMFLFGHLHRELSNIAQVVGGRTNTHRLLHTALINIRLVNQVMGFFAWVILLGGGLYGLLTGRITAGDFTLIGAQAMLLINRALQLADKLPDIIEYFGTAQEALNTLIHPTPKRNTFPALQMDQPSVEFRDIHFGYGPEAVVFQGLNLSIKPGEKIGLVGPSGSGKSTLVGLLMRLYEIQGGQINVGGHDVQKVDVESLRGAMAFIPQDTSLFHRTVAENIRYSRPDATDEEIVEAAKAAQADQFISKMGKGYGTTVGERGVKLSGGQRQRIAIARALVKNAPILLLDEATSALDSESEHMIQAAIKKAMEGRTVIAIAHRLSTLADMDRVIVMENGQIVEDGPHHELMAKGGLYARLWQHQSGGFLNDRLN